jgi:hypothetical protein
VRGTRLTSELDAATIISVPLILTTGPAHPPAPDAGDGNRGQPG